MVPMWMFPIAIMVGNSFIWKPSEKTAMTSQLLAQGFKDSGLPDGILNVIQGDKETVDLLCAHDDIKAIALLGPLRSKTCICNSNFIWQKSLNFRRRVKIIFLMPMMPQTLLQLKNIVIIYRVLWTALYGSKCAFAIGDCDKIITDIVNKAKNFIPTKDIGHYYQTVFRKVQLVIEKKPTKMGLKLF